MSVYHEPDLSYDKRRTAMFTILGLVLAAVVLACLYFAFNPRVEAAPVNTDVTSMAVHPTSYFGRKVVFSGRIASAVNGSAFTVIDPNAAVGSQFLVISTKPLPPVAARPQQPTLMPGDVVAVEGQYRRLSPNDRYAGIDTTAAEYKPYYDQPVVYANVVTPPGTSAVVVTPHAATSIPTQPVYTGQASPRDRRAEITVIRQDSSTLLNQRVQVVNAVVTEVDSDRGFWIKGSSPERLFVVLSPGLDKKPVEWMVVVKPGQTVTINGVITSLPDARTLQKKWKMSRTASAELAKEQVYLYADGIYIKQP